MPCNSIVQNRVQWNEEHTDLDLLSLAMKKLGYKAITATRFRNTQGNEVELRNGKLITIVSRYETIDTDAIKQGYSCEVVKKAARSYGWKIEEKGNNEFEVVKGH